VAAMDSRLLRPRQRGRTLYFQPTGLDASWDSLSNWYSDAAYTRPATRLPTSDDSVVSVGAWVPVWTGLRTVSRFTLDDQGDGQGITGELVARAGATFRGAVEVGLTITGSATLSDAAYLVGSVSRVATFTDSACNAGGSAGVFVPDPPPSCP
jgi:hypothetical protein